MKTFLSASLLLTSISSATTISTSFDLADGFAAQDTNDIVLSDNGFQVTFSGGQAERRFDGPSYRTGPSAFFFVNGPSFEGSFGRTINGTGDVGTVSFNIGVLNLSFAAADRANGTGAFRILDQLGNTLASQSVTNEVNRNSDLFEFSSDDFGGTLIGGIEFDNAGPNMNPPYVIAIDDFSATAVPEPSSALLVGASLSLLALRRRRQR